MSMHAHNMMLDLQKQIDTLRNSVVSLQSAFITEQAKRSELASRLATLESGNRTQTNAQKQPTRA